jgi:hypothetical protein
METELAALVERMEAAAERFRVTKEVMLALALPEGLKDNIVIDGQKYLVQFSHDEMSENRVFRHLSFAREDREIPTDREKTIFRTAFFGKTEVLEFPGNPVFGKHIAHFIGMKK